MEVGDRARPRDYVRDPRNNKAMHRLSCNKFTHEHGSINPAGEHVYWGRDRVAAIDRFWASHRPAPLQMSAKHLGDQPFERE